MKKSFLDTLISKIDRIDTGSVQNYLLKLVKEKGFFETIFNTIHEGVIVIEKNLTVKYVNNAAIKLLGLPDNVENRSIEKFIKGINWKSIISKDINTWSRVSRQEIEVFYPVHRFLNFYLVPHTISDKEENFYLTSIIFHDVTEARENVEKTIESNKTKVLSMLSAGVAHEIGNPLNSINIHLQLLNRSLKKLDLDNKDELQEYVDIAQSELARLDRIINNFLKAVRPVPLSLKRISIKKILSESLRFMSHEIENKGIHIEALWLEKLPSILADEDRLSQAFYNIIKNAVQAMPDGGLLRVECNVNNDLLNINFTDTGKGISEEDISRIMEPYYTTQEEGTGLGLMIVERIIRDHGGEFGIESEVDEGTIFTIRLPLRNRQTRLLESPLMNPYEEEDGEDTQDV